MPISVLDINQVAEIAEFAGVPEEAIFIDFEGTVGGKVYFWTEKIPLAVTNKMLSVKAASYSRSFRFRLVCHLKDYYYAEGYLTKEKPSRGMSLDNATPLSLTSNANKCVTCGKPLNAGEGRELNSKSKCWECNPFTPYEKRKRRR